MKLGKAEMIHTPITPSAARLRSALIVDDHPLFCDALSMTLQAVSGIRQVSTAPCMSDAVQLLHDGPQPDLVVLDLNLPDAEGLDAVYRLRAATRAPIMVVSSIADNRTLSAVIHAGAAGYVPKHSQRDVFRRAVEALRQNRRFIPAGHMLLDDVSSARTDAATRLASLTPQQGRILDLICAGKLNKQIAFDLSIAEATVKAHVTAILRKLGVQNRTQAVLIARESRFREPATGAGTL